VGYAFGSIDEMGDGVFRKVRQELGVTAFHVTVFRHGVRSCVPTNPPKPQRSCWRDGTNLRP
jgi:hypothetical protein